MKNWYWLYAGIASLVTVPYTLVALPKVPIALAILVIYASSVLLFRAIDNFSQ